MIADEFAAFWPQAVRFAASRGATDAENVAAEALLKCWRAEQRGREPRREYVMRAVKNLVADQRRRRAIVEEVALGAIDPTTRFDDSDPDGVLAVLTPLQAHIAQRLAGGWRVFEIAAELGIDHSAVVQRRQRAARRLERLGY